MKSTHPNLPDKLRQRTEDNIKLMESEQHQLTDEQLMFHNGMIQLLRNALLSKDDPMPMGRLELLLECLELARQDKRLTKKEMLRKLRIYEKKYKIT